METILETAQLTKRYGQSCALRDLDMKVEKGSIYGLVGRNGAGKTTLIRIVCGLQRPSAGTYRLWGTRSDSPAITGMRRRMSAIVESPSMYMGLSAIDNIRQQYRILGRPSMDGAEMLLELVGLGDTGRKKAASFSLGMKQRLGIAIALAGDPDLLVLDEPTNGLDPQGIIELRELLLRLNRERQITLLISSHNLDELSRLATHYGFIDGGRMIREVSAEELEAACRKCARLTVSDVRILARVLDGMQVEYKVLSDTQADVYARLNVSQLTLALDREGCEVTALEERDESLESYYVNLVGGGRHA